MRLLHSKLTMKQYMYVTKGGRVEKKRGGGIEKKKAIHKIIDVSVLVVKLHIKPCSIKNNLATKAVFCIRHLTASYLY